MLEGLRFSRALPLLDSTHSPLIKFLKTFGITAVAMRIPPWASFYVPLIDWDQNWMMQRSSETQSSKRVPRRQRAPAQDRIGHPSTNNKPLRSYWNPREQLRFVSSPIVCFE